MKNEEMSRIRADGKGRSTSGLNERRSGVATERRCMKRGEEEGNGTHRCTNTATTWHWQKQQRKQQRRGGAEREEQQHRAREVSERPPAPMSPLG